MPSKHKSCHWQEFRDAWWEAELEEAGRQLGECLENPAAWTPAHLAYDAALRDDWDDVYGASNAGARYNTPFDADRRPACNH